MKGYPQWFSVRFIFALVFVLFLTGVFLTPTTLEFRMQWDMIWRLTSDQRLLVVALHVGASFVMMLVIGALWSVHMRRGWRIRRHYRSGILLVSLWIFLMVSGLGIYYVSNEKGLLITSLIHLLAGYLVFIVFFFHVVCSRMSK